MSKGFLLDTVVISELRKGLCAEPAVIAWQATATTLPSCLSVITLLEIRLSLRRVQSRDAAFAARLQAQYDDHLLPCFKETLLPVTLAVAESAAELSATRSITPLRCPYRCNRPSAWAYLGHPQRLRFHRHRRARGQSLGTGCVTGK